MPSDATRADVLRLARSCLEPKVRFKHQGRSPKAGMDCAGLLIWIGMQTGLMPFDFTAYERYPDGRTVRQLFNEQLCRLASLEEARPGDVVLLRDIDTRWPCHMGILTDLAEPFGLIHSWWTASGVTEHRLAENWQAKIVGVYAYRGLEEQEWVPR